MKQIWVAVLLMIAPAAAQAADVALGLDGQVAVATISLPASWIPKPGAHGIEAASPDGTAFIVAKMLKPGLEAAAAYNVEIIGYFESQGVIFPVARGDAEPATTDTDTAINGLDVFVSRLDEPVTDRGRPVTITYYAIPIGETQTLNIVTRGPRDDKTLPGIIATVKPVK